MRDEQWFKLVILVSIFFFVLKFIFSIHTRPGNLPPSPRALPIIGHFHHLKQPIHRTLDKLSKKYGPVMFLKLGTRKVVVVSSPMAVQECFTTKDIIFANRPELLAGKLLNYNNTTMGFSSYGDHWRNLRRFTFAP